MAMEHAYQEKMSENQTFYVAYCNDMKYNIVCKGGN